MSSVKKFFVGTVLLFSAILIVAAFKQKKPAQSAEPVTLFSDESAPQEIPVAPLVVEAPMPVAAPPPPVPIALPPVSPTNTAADLPMTADFAEVDQIDRLFTFDPSLRLPIVETVSFTSRVPWLKGRPAWVADYASYYETSRHFIARSLNQKSDYFSQKVGPGDKFNTDGFLVVRQNGELTDVIYIITLKLEFFHAIIILNCRTS